MSELVWGVPVQRKTKVEKFNTPVVTMSAIEEGKGRKFLFNKAAIKLLGLVGGESHISFGFGNEGQIAIMASSDETGNSFPLAKQYSISNKKTAEYIAKSRNLNTSIENYLHLELTEGQPYAVVSNISNDESEIADAPAMNAPEEVNEIEEEIVEDRGSFTPSTDLDDEKTSEENWD